MSHSDTHFFAVAISDWKSGPYRIIVHIMPHNRRYLRDTHYRVLPIIHKNPHLDYCSEVLVCYCLSQKRVMLLNIDQIQDIWVTVGINLWNAEKY